MANKRETIILHDYGGGLRTGVTERFTRAGKGGKFSIDIEATPLVFHFDERALSAEPAAAVIKAVQEDMLNQPTAAQATRDKRTYHARLWRSGKRPAWLQRMYSGGRMGEYPPKSGTESPRRWSGSSRLFDSLTARWVERAGAWITNVAANRLNRRDLANKFVEDMDTLANLRQFVSSREFQKALSKSMETAVQKARSIADTKRAELRARQLAVAKGLMEIGRAAIG